MEELSIDDFTAWVGEDCEVAIADERLAMTLVAAEQLEGSPRAAGGFRLELLGPVEPILAQNIVQVRRPGLDHEIFIVPVASDRSGTRYEATFY